MVQKFAWGQFFLLKKLIFVFSKTTPLSRTTVFNIDNNMLIKISEGSCDTEDWRSDAENSALITGINYSLKYI